ncbi:tryptophan synthase beta subunit-like PLP-dependent enzyme [Globomyces pollinis-pini]|nr:tryptophan synthase beta subunit-like PLP-dependent enzyme [Globomyces pollinis-pini]
MPSTSPQVKKNAVRDYGAKIIECEPTLLARETTADEVIKRTNATFIHPYNNLNIIAGQGTLALEFLDQVSNLDCMVIPVGGGGLLSGTCIAAKSRNPNIRIFAAEPAKVDDCFRSFKSKKLLLGADNARSVADGLLTSLGDYTWPIIQSLVEDVFIVTEQQIIDAMRLIWERMKLIVEPSAAVAVAVLLYNVEFAKLKGIKSIGIVLEGGNVDLAKLPWQIQSSARL